MPERVGLALSFNALDPEAPVDFDPVQLPGSESFFERLAARLGALVASVSQSLASAASGSHGSQAAAGTRLPTELLLSNHDPAGDDELGEDPIDRSQPDAATGSALAGFMDRLRLSGSAGGVQSTAGYVSSSGLSGSFDAASPPQGMPLGSRFVEAYPLVYTVNGIAPPPPGLVMGRMIPDPLPLRK